MTRREKILAMVTGTAMGCFVLYAGVDKLLLAPAREAQEQALSLRNGITELQRANAKQDGYQRRLAAFDERVFGDTESEAVSAMQGWLMTLLHENNLSTQSLKPIRGRVVPKVYAEAGWAVSAQGAQDDVVTFLHQLQADPHLHRVDNVLLTPLLREGKMDLQLRCTTLMLDRASGERAPTTRLAEITPAEPDDERRRGFEMIASRDLFRPYVKRPPPPPPPSPMPAQPPPSRGEPAPAQPDYRVADLSTWAGVPEVYVRDPATRQERVFRVGDKLAGGRIVLIDYRVMPKHNDPEILCSSRVIVRIGESYYAIERGDRLTEKYPLRPEQLPDELKASDKESAPPAQAADGRKAV